jgi:hypothetical protein
MQGIRPIPVGPRQGLFTADVASRGEMAIGCIAGFIEGDRHQQGPEGVAVSEVEITPPQAIEEGPAHRLDYILLVLEDPNSLVEMTAGQDQEPWEVTLPEPPRRIVAGVRGPRPEATDLLRDGTV